MKILFKKEGNFLIPFNQKENEKISKLKDGNYQVEINNCDIRTISQNSAMWLFANMVAASLNNAGATFDKLLKQNKYSAEIEWNKDLVIDMLWKPIQVAVTNKKSTTQLEKSEIDKVYDALNRYLTVRVGIDHIPFPSVENIKENNV